LFQCNFSFYSAKSSLQDEYSRIDFERVQDPSKYLNKIVYDCIDPSPFYESDTYIDEADAIEIPPEESHCDYK